MKLSTTEILLLRDLFIVVFSFSVHCYCKRVIFNNNNDYYYFNTLVYQMHNTIFIPIYCIS